MLNKSDYEILNILYEEKIDNQFKAFSIKDICEKSSYSQGKIRMSLKVLIEHRYIEKGLKDGNSDTFFITQKGNSTLSMLMS